MATPEQRKRRPPPIKIPPPPPARAVPGPNAFALAAKAKENAERQEHQAENNNPLASPIEDARPARASSQRQSVSSGVGSVMTTFTQLLQADRNSTGSSPALRSNTHSVGSRRGSTRPPSRLSHKSNHSTGSTQPVFAGLGQAQNIFGIDEEEDGTARADIEDVADKKARKVMDGVPADDPRHFTSGGRFKAADTGSESSHKRTQSAKKKTEAPKSPKKKIFGMSIPMFGKSNAPPLVGKTDMLPPPVFPKLQPNAHLIAPTVSSKAAGVLGASPRPSTAAPPGKCHPALRQRKSPPRSQSAKSLPVPDLHDPHKQYRNRQRHHGSMPARKRTPSRPSKSFSQTQVEDSSNEVHNDASPGSSIPPTPPKKDTPKELKANQSTGEETEGRTHKQGENRENVDTPDFTTSESSIPSGGGESPNKYWPPTAEDYAKLIEQPYIASAQAVMSDAAIELEGDAYKDLFKGDDTEQQQKYPDWWNEEREKRFSSMKGETLPPTFYSPSVFSAHLFDGNPSQNTDPSRLLFRIPSLPRAATTSTQHTDGERASIDMVFQGNASEIDPFSNMSKASEGPAEQQDASTPRQHGDNSFQSRVIRELQRNQPEPPSEGTGSPRNESQRPRLEVSSSRLTDILNGVSPSKTGYNYDYNFPSAVPSPLHGMSEQNIPSLRAEDMRSPVPSGNPVGQETLPDGGTILSHFNACHAHIDALGQILYDLIAQGKAESNKEVQSIKDSQMQLMTTLAPRFEELKNEIKPQLRETMRTCESASEQSQMQTQMINSKLDKLLQYVKDEIVDRLEQQSKKVADLESSVTALHNTVHELEKTVQSTPTPTSSQPRATSNPFSSPPPQHRSQPSLLPYLENMSIDPGRDSHQRPMQAIPEGRSDARYQHNYGANGAYNGLTQGSQQWLRPSTAGREGSHEASNYFPNQQYQARSGYMGYNPVYPANSNDQGFSYNSGAPK